MHVHRVRIRSLWPRMGLLHGLCLCTHLGRVKVSGIADGPPGSGCLGPSDMLLPMTCTAASNRTSPGARRDTTCTHIAAWWWPSACTKTHRQRVHSKMHAGHVACCVCCSQLLSSITQRAEDTGAQRTTAAAPGSCKGLRPPHLGPVPDDHLPAAAGCELQLPRQ